MEHKLEMTYGSQQCEEFLKIVLETGLGCVSVQTRGGTEIATIIPGTNVPLYATGISGEALEDGDKLYLVYNRIRVMSHLSALAQLANVLFHHGELGTKQFGD